MPIKLKRRNFWQRLPHAPGLFLAHYAILRTYCGRREAARAALGLTVVFMKPLGKR